MKTPETEVEVIRKTIKTLNVSEENVGDVVLAWAIEKRGFSVNAEVHVDFDYHGIRITVSETTTES